VKVHCVRMRCSSLTGRFRRSRIVARLEKRLEDEASEPPPHTQTLARPARPSLYGTLYMQWVPYRGACMYAPTHPSL
jgi:hypothetical protein